MTLRVLIVLEAGDAAPSGFIRGLIYRDYFKRNGFDIRYVNRLYPPLVRFFNHPSRRSVALMQLGLARLLNLVQSVIARFNEDAIVRMARHYDVVYMSKMLSFSLLSRFPSHIDCGFQHTAYAGSSDIL